MVKRLPMYFNRELSWLEFNRRVLELAQSSHVPLLERVRFLGITGSNLDEFFMVRVGGLQILQEQGSNRQDKVGMTASEQLQAVAGKARELVDQQYCCLLEILVPQLTRHGIVHVDPAALEEALQPVLVDIFEREIFPVLTPIAITGDAAMPLLGNGDVYLGVRLQPAEEDLPEFAVIPLGRILPRFVSLSSESGYKYLMLEQVVELFVSRFFPERAVLECAPFRVTRNADMAVREDMATDLMEGMVEVLEARKRSPCVRMEVAARASDTLKHFLQASLGLEDDEVYAVPGPLDLKAYMKLADLEGFDALRYDPRPPKSVPDLEAGESIFSILRDRDLLLSHPYDSYEPVIRLVEEAAEDEDVLAVKMTLYRASSRSRMVAALERAALQGKYVTAVVELKARFDEDRNIGWAKRLEQAGVQVIYGVRGLKTHSKALVVIRRDEDGIRRYVHFGTGNYNESTARLYTDISYMTSKEDYGADATAFFNAVTGYTKPKDFRLLNIAPINLRDRILEQIDHEIERARSGEAAFIIGKMNSLVDPAITEKLYEASKAGVKVKLNIRGICCLRPGVKKASETIEVRSIVGRYLEHSRVFWFHHGGEERFFISSADWMPRNLDKRVELLIPVQDESAKKKMIHYMNTCLQDQANTWVLSPDGSYIRQDHEGADAHLGLYEKALEEYAEAAQVSATEFVPYRPKEEH